MLTVVNTEIKTKTSKIQRLIKPLWIIFGITLFIALCIFVFVIFIQQKLFNEVSIVYGLFFLIFLAISGFSFLSVIFLYLLNSETGKDRITFRRIVLAFLTLPVLPLYLLIKPFTVKQKLDLKVVKSVFPFILLTPVWLLTYIVSYYVATDELFLGTRYQITPLAETSSMSPSFSGGSIGKYFPYKNFIYKLNKNNAYKFQRGDVITFSNQATRDYLAKQGNDHTSGFIKRVIGLPGDVVELKAGVVFINGQPLVEQYTQEANSTYGLDYKWAKDNGLPGLFLDDCQKATVPSRELFVLGDNRKNSTDSRYIGFVSFDDVNGYYSLEDQKKPYYEGINLINNSANWRDTSNDLNSKVLLDISSYCK